MKFNIKEWSFIRHCIECSQRDFEKQVADSKYSDDSLSSHQIFSKQVSECAALIEKITTTEV